MSTPDTITEHCRRHELSGPQARESFLFDVKLPDDEVAGLVYTWVDAENRAGSAAWICRPEHAGGTVFEFQDQIAVEADRGFDDWVAGPLTVAMRDGNDRSTVAYRSERIELELEFRPMHEPYLYSRSPAGSPPYFADDRLEQSGDVTGRLRIDDRRVEFATQAHHDHSWGTRDWGAVQHYKWFQAQAPGTSVHVFDLNAFGERPLIGYIHRDGTTADVVSAQWDVDYDERYFQQRVQLRVEDALGRTSVTEAVRFAEFVFPVSPMAHLQDTMMAATIDGVRGSAFVDFLWPPDYVKHITGANEEA